MLSRITLAQRNILSHNFKIQHRNFMMPPIIPIVTMPVFYSRGGGNGDGDEDENGKIMNIIYFLSYGGFILGAGYGGYSYLRDLYKEKKENKKLNEKYQYLSLKDRDFNLIELSFSIVLGSMFGFLIGATFPITAPLYTYFYVKEKLN